MSTLSFLLIAPLLWSITIPLIIFAAFTTSLAFTTLLLRALVVYIELAAALIQNQFAQEKAPNGAVIPSKLALSHSGAKHTRRKSRRGSAASGSSNGSVTPREQRPSSGLGVYGGQSATRDFEGVGGWRMPGPSDDDQPWLNINSRLELPTTVDGGGGGRRRNHHRSRTSGSLTSIPLPTKTPTPPGFRPPGTASPEEYFSHRSSSKSTTALDAANIGKALLRHQPSHSSASSGSSAHTSHLTVSNT